MDGKRADAGISARADRRRQADRLRPGCRWRGAGNAPPSPASARPAPHRGAGGAALGGRDGRGLAPGEVVFREGEPSRAVLFVREGEVEVAKAAGTGEVVLGTVGPGEFA